MLFVVTFVFCLSCYLQGIGFALERVGLCDY